MGKLAIRGIVILTALVTAVLTSLFWILVYTIAHAPNDASAPATATPRPAPAVPVPRAEPIVAPSGLAVPVAGIRPGQLTDTFTQARAGGRPHDAIDIMAPAGTPVIAAAEGTVEKLYFSHGGGGITAYVRSPDRRWMYYYAHLQAYAAGLHEGQRVARGDPIGLVGSTGNANPAGPHLHFAINRMAADERWWQGTPVNPYPLLASAPR